MHREGFATRIAPEGPALAGLEDRFRPTSSAALPPSSPSCSRNAGPTSPSSARMNQQLRGVAQIARDLDLGVRVIGSRTMRERDGLAMPSRNVYLSADQRRAAPILHRVLKDATPAVRDDMQA